MICVETIGKIRRWHRVDKLSISKIARRLSASRNTIAKYLEGEVTQPRYKTRAKRAPVMGAWVVKLEAMLAEDAERPRKEQRTAQRLHDGLVQEVSPARIRRYNGSSRHGARSARHGANRCDEVQDIQHVVVGGIYGGNCTLRT